MARSYVPYEGPIVTREQAILNGQKKYFTGSQCRHGHISQRVLCDWSCDECTRIKCKERRTRKIETEREKGRQRRSLNPEKANAQCRTWRLNNMEKVREYDKKYRIEKCETVRAKDRRHRTRRKGVYGSHTKEQILNLFDKQHGRCMNCLVSVKSGYHVDHIMPISKGGTDWISNLQILCAPCNHSKHALDPFEWARRNGRLL